MDIDQITKSIRVRLSGVGFGTIIVEVNGKEYKVVSNNGEYRLVDYEQDSEPDPGTEDDPVLLEDCKFLDTNVSNWDQAITLQSVTRSGGKLRMPYRSTIYLKPVKIFGDKDPLVANPWVIFEYNGKWYASTFEWLKDGQYEKPDYTVNSAHIKHADIPVEWKPKDGQKIGFMITGLARDGHAKNAKVRSNIVWITW